MLLWARAPDFDLYRRNAGTSRHVHPSIASPPKRIDRIRNYSVGYAVANVVQGLVKACPVTNGLLYRVDAQVHSADLTRQFSGEGRFANAGQPAEDNQHSPIIEPHSRTRVSSQMVGASLAGSATSRPSLETENEIPLAALA
jgi:hypothetical protein